MIGYIYITKNKINNKIYIGKHKSPKYIKSYYGSGKNILKDIKKYGKENFSNEMIYQADTLEDLNEKEKFYIEKYRKEYGSLLYNIAKGGDGGDTFSGLSIEEKNVFVQKMTKINKERCQTEDFKNNASIRMKEKYSNPEERKKQSEAVRKAWANEELRKKHSDILKKYFKTHKVDASCHYIPCNFTLGEISIDFENIKALKQFLKNEYSFGPSNPKLKEIMINGTNGIPYHPFYKNKYAKLDGMILSYI